MQLQDRDLELENVGDDVALLQRELRTIGLPIDREELDAKLFGRTTHRAVRFLQEVSGDDLRALDWQGRFGVVERATAILINRIHDLVVNQREIQPPAVAEPEYRVFGTVRNATREPLARATVNVLNQNVLGPEPLRSAPTNESGSFDISFDFSPEDGAEARSPLAPPAPDLRFSVVDPSGHDRRVMALSKLTDGTESYVERIAFATDAPFIIVNALKQTQINLYVDDAAAHDSISEFEEVEARLAPALQRLSYNELQEGNGHYQVSFLAAETGILATIIERLIASARSSRVTANHDRLVPVAVFYGLAHGTLPVDLGELARRPRVELTSTLRAAVDENVIPNGLAVDIDRHVDAILSIGAELALSTSLGEGSASTGEWLQLAGLAPAAQQDLLRELGDHEGPSEILWERLREDDRFGGQEKVRRAELVLRLASFTSDNFTLVNTLLETSDVRSPADIAKFDEAEWVSLVTRAGMPKMLLDEGESEAGATTRYARDLHRLAQQIYPTAAIEGIAARSHLELDLDAGVSTWLGAARRAAEDGTVPPLDLRSTHIERYFEEHAERIEFSSQNSERLRADLKRVQRTLTIAQEPAWIVPLLRAGHDSALHVANMPADAFAEIHSEALGIENARAIHARACQIHFAHLFVHTMVFDALKDEGVTI